MRFPGIVVVAWLSFSVAGCAVGGWGRAQKGSSGGGNAKVTTTTHPVQGELLVADTSGALLLAGSEIVHIPWSTIRKIDVADYPVSLTLDGTAPSAVMMKQVQLASRYPFGLSDEQLRILLGATGQNEVREIR